MARDQVDMTPIETREELIAWFEAGSKPKSQFRIGTEHEKFVFTVEGHNPVPYDGSRSIRALLEGMQHLLGWEPIIENGNIIGLFDVTSGGAISLEPGGQFELSGAPLETVHQTCSELMAHLAQVKEIARPLGIGFLGLGMTPNWRRAEIPMMPKGRYRIMPAYMPKVGMLRSSKVDFPRRGCGHSAINRVVRVVSPPRLIRRRVLHAEGQRNYESPSRRGPNLTSAGVIPNVVVRDLPAALWPGLSRHAHL